MILSSIPHATAGFLTHLADAAARSFVLGCIAGVGLKVSRVRSVALRLNVWRAVLCVALMMPFLGLFLPALTFRLPAQVGQRVEELRSAYRAVDAVTNNNAGEPARAAEIARNSSERHVSHSFANTLPESRGLTGGTGSCGSQGSRIGFTAERNRIFTSARGSLGQVATCRDAVDRDRGDSLSLGHAGISGSFCDWTNFQCASRTRGAARSRSTGAGAAFIARTSFGNQTRSAPGRVRTAFRAGDFRRGASRDICFLRDGATGMKPSWMRLSRMRFRTLRGATHSSTDCRFCTVPCFGSARSAGISPAAWRNLRKRPAMKLRLPRGQTARVTPKRCLAFSRNSKRVRGARGGRELRWLRQGRQKNDWTEFSNGKGVSPCN